MGAPAGLTRPQVDPAAAALHTLHTDCGIVQGDLADTLYVLTRILRHHYSASKPAALWLPMTWLFLPMTSLSSPPVSDRS